MTQYLVARLFERHQSHYRGKRHARITEIRRRKSQKTSDPAKLDSDGNQTATDQSAFSESDNNQPVQAQGAEMTDTMASSTVVTNEVGVEPKEPKSEVSLDRLAIKNARVSWP